MFTVDFSPVPCWVHVCILYCSYPTMSSKILL